MKSLRSLLCTHMAAIRFLIVGGAASLVHAAISWVLYYHVWVGWTLLSTLAGYGGGWVVSYLGNRLWSFRQQSEGVAVVTSVSKFVLSQLISMGVLLAVTWGVQQIIKLYFWWYIVTNKLAFTPELQQFSAGASYPPALICGMGLAAIVSYFIMRSYVFRATDQQ